jgi:lipid-A-disaccharide synthase
MPKSPHILLIAGDPSADRHGASLVEALRTRQPTLRVSAVGGPHLRQTADAFLFPLVDVGGFGFWEPLLKWRQLWQAWKAIRNLIREDPPDLVVPVDYYGFNIHVARLAHSRGIAVVYYISPQVWASRPYRIQKLSAVVRKMLVIFPFETVLYEKANVPVSFVGHPLLERLPPPGFESLKPTVGFLPGSRQNTIRRHMPVLVETAQRLRQQRPDLECVIIRPEEIAESFYTPFLGAASWIRVEADPSYARRKAFWVTIGVSGTAALENTLLGIPMVIMYKLSPLSYRIAKKLIRVPFVGIPNLLAGRAIVSEYLQEKATPEALCQAAQTLLADSRQRAEMRKSLLALRAALREGGSHRAAEEILKELAGAEKVFA